MNKIYYLSTCSTCKRIIKELSLDSKFEFQDIKSDPVTSEQLDEMRKHVDSYADLFNKRARKIRSLELDLSTFSESDFRDWILKDYTFLKRPVLVVKGKYFIGNSSKVVKKAEKLIRTAD